ncbi:DUF1549 and DUF1553 domain-containing protein [Verrucomicrobia bacterium]|nr:DUF1549 and DUF1553 domain-containing protein [Verrucomicrobiota bacterium]MDB4691723.1 DUF1549 and DUF1553 domain-containing protein [Verrucomicrobiota bacterium]
MKQIVTLLIALACGVVQSLASDRVDFVNDVMPVLTKVGCNTGACHGSAAGRGNFKLSLYGGNPQADYEAIVREISGRRINLQKPEESLIILKPTFAIDHGGKFLLDDDDDGTQLLLRWIQEGAEKVTHRELERVEFTPRTYFIEKTDVDVQLRAEAFYADGSSQDVTPWTVFSAEDSSAVRIDKDSAVATPLRGGRHIITARYLDSVAPIEIVIPLSDKPVDLASQPRGNFIDDEVLSRLTTLRLPVSPQADDSTFIRRVSLDLTGRLPEPDKVLAYLENRDQNKNEELIDELVQADAFNEYWSYKFAKWLRMGKDPNDEDGIATYRLWLSNQIEKGVGYNEITRTLILATGDTHNVGPANFYRTVDGPRKQAEFVSELFMGSRLRCANCHNHPFDKWTQDDYHGLASIFSKIENAQIVRVRASGDVIHPRTREPAVARIPGEYYLKDKTQDGREDLAEWLTAEDNPYFAKAIVNRLWSSLMGRGLVEPVDDMRDTNPATHPKLLNRLAEDFAASGYRLRPMLKRIATSATYARSSNTVPGNAEDDRYYSHALRRPLEAEVLADGISYVLNVPAQYGGKAPGQRAVTLVDLYTPSRTLDILGRCGREESCESETSISGGLTRNLHLLNGELINVRIRREEGRLARFFDADTAPMDIIDELYLVALSRKPAGAMRRFWREQLANVESVEQQQRLLEDFVWSLLASSKFNSK